MRRSLNGEVDDQLQRGSKGKRRRYFLAAVVRREQDALLKRLHVHSLRMPDAAHGRQQPSGSRLALPMPTFMPLAEKNEQPGERAPPHLHVIALSSPPWTILFYAHNHRKAVRPIHN